MSAAQEKFLGPGASWEEKDLPESFTILQRASKIKDMLKESHNVSVENLSRTDVTIDDLIAELRCLISISAVRGHIGTTSVATDLLMDILLEEGL